MKRSPKLDVPAIRVRRGTQPLPAQIAAGLRDAIGSGALTPGSRLPSSRVLARRLGVSRNTVLAGYEMLAADGLVAGRVGSGTRVAANAASVLRLAGGASPEQMLRVREAGFPIRPCAFRDPDGHGLYVHE
jgi:DNA-binding GntR family transcriptional regulator